MIISELQDSDLKVNWHPCSQMKDYETFKPLVVKKAYGSTIELADGRTLIDAFSSWWCKSLGHQHPALKSAMQAQMDAFEHIVFANTTHENIVKLSHRLTNLMPHFSKVFYAGDGSCAVEIALKMSIHTRVIRHQKQRNRFIALSNGYHGETLATLSVSDVGLYREPYKNCLFDTVFIDPLYTSGQLTDEWADASEYWSTVEKQLLPLVDTTTAIIVEPILQGAGNMQIYSADFLKRLAEFAKAHDIHLIADEIMTGFGRTGKMLACEHAEVQPDFACLSKGLTSGWLPFSAVVTTDDIYHTFYDDYDSGKAFLHSHTFTGNPLGAAVANAVFDVMESERICASANRMEIVMRQHMKDIQQTTGKLQNIRSIGGMVAADLIASPKQKRLGYEIYKTAVQLGALLRPLGNTLYWLPPLNTNDQTLAQLKEITEQAIIRTLK